MFHGCTKKADVLSFHTVLTSADGRSRWDCYINVCEDHFDDLVRKNIYKDKDDNDE